MNGRGTGAGNAPASGVPADRGWFITFEGGEGCGKSTQVARLVARLRGMGRRVRELREPGGTPLAEEIRHTLKHSPHGAAMVPEAELLLMNAARAQLVREVIRPSLAAAEVVICDRFYHSTLAYQGWGRGLDRARVDAVVDIAVGDTRPDLTFWLHVAPEVAAQRRRERARAAGGVGDGATEDRFERSGAEFFARVEAGFAALAMEEPGRIVPIDAGPPADAVESVVWSHLRERLGIRGPAVGIEAP